MRIYLLKRKGQLSKENHEKGKSKKVSLYLMYHFGKGRKREYEFLNLQLFDKPKTQLERDHNKQTLQLAETIKAKKQVDLQTTSHGFISSVKSEICFLSFIKTLVDKKFDSDGNHGNWLSTYLHLCDFANGKEIPLKNVDDRFLELFKEYLLNCKTRKGKNLTKLNKNTAQSYFNKVRTIKRLKKHWHELWTFLEYNAVPWNNNNAEAAIKAFAQHRRNVNGQFSENGLKEYLSMLTIAQTCRYRNISFLDFMRRRKGIWHNIHKNILPLEFLPFQQAKLFIRRFRFKNKREWHKWIEENKRPFFIPPDPSEYYKNLGWKDWDDWLLNTMQFSK